VAAGPDQRLPIGAAARRLVQLLVFVLVPTALGATFWSVSVLWRGAPAATEIGPVPVFPLKIAAGRRYLVDQNDVPFLIHGEAAWSIIVQLTREEAERYLDDRRRRGFNLVLVNLLENKFADHPPLNVYGQGPFTSPDDFSTPNEAYFDHADWVIRQAEARGMAVLLCPAYLGFEGGDEGWYQTMVRNGTDKLREYGKYVGARYKTHDNLLWLEAGDFTPPADKLELVDAVAEGIKAGDPRHLHTAHFSPRTSAIDVAVSGWLDLNVTYTYAPVYEKCLADYNRSDDRPTLLVETTYEDEVGESTPPSLRAAAYYALLSGAAGQIFGNHWIWQFKPTRWWRILLHRSWLTALDTPGSRSMMHVRSLFAPRAWPSLVPDQRSEVLVEGQGQRGSRDYALLARSEDGRLAIAYVPTPRPITIDRARLAKPLAARWYDPTNGTFLEIGEFARSVTDRATVRPPAANAAGDSDWVLVLESP